ncbi:MAG: hypothetical protein ABI591_04805 [Kofleriaceae bacterium]
MYLRCSILLVWLGCGIAPLATDAAIGHDDGRGAMPLDAAHGAADAFSGVDGPPTRMPCTSQFGSALPAAGTFGRLDGYLVAVVAPGATNGCNDDGSHVHLQIKMNGAIYDIAIDATNGQTQTDDVHTGTLDIAMPSGPAWTEGFHTGVTIDYPSLGVHSSALPLNTKAQIVSTITAELATVNHISIFTTSYGGTGAHLVHRNSGGQDGVVVIEPLSTPSHLRLFSFSDQSF